MPDMRKALAGAATKKPRVTFVPGVAVLTWINVVRVRSCIDITPVIPRKRCLAFAMPDERRRK
jgi:hypothetical protein